MSFMFWPQDNIPTCPLLKMHHYHGITKLIALGFVEIVWRQLSDAETSFRRELLRLCDRSVILNCVITQSDWSLVQSLSDTLARICCSNATLVVFMVCPIPYFVIQMSVQIQSQSKVASYSKTHKILARKDQSVPNSVLPLCTTEDLRPSAPLLCRLGGRLIETFEMLLRRKIRCYLLWNVDGTEVKLCSHFHLSEPQSLSLTFRFFSFQAGLQCGIWFVIGCFEECSCHIRCIITFMRTHSCGDTSAVRPQKMVCCCSNFCQLKQQVIDSE